MAKDRTIEGYIGGLTGWQADAVQQLRELVLEAAPEVKGSIKWAQPVFEMNGPVCYVRAFKQHVNFGFWRGAELPDPEGLIQTGGEKMGHVRIAQLADIRPDLLKALVRAAVELNQTKGDPTRQAA